MIGLMPVKEQVRSIAASIEAARRRAVAGVTTEKPIWDFVFLGPPGTGKTTVARVLAKIFYAFGLIEMPDATEANWATAIETTSWSIPRWAECCSSMRRTGWPVGRSRRC